MMRKKGSKKGSRKKGASSSANDTYLDRVLREIDARSNRVKTIHLCFASWSIERKMISTHIEDACSIASCVTEIIADYTGSAHGRTLDLVHNSHKHIFTSRFASVAIGVDNISAGELMGNFEHILGPLGYRSTMAACSTYGPDRATRKLILGLLCEIIDLHGSGADEQRVTDMFYQIILLTWSDHASAI
jgi:hypothetical protein